MNRYTSTIAACHAGYVCQAVVNNFLPLLFVTLQGYGVTVKELSAIILLNFATQLLVDLFSARLADVIGCRPLAVTAHIFAAAGLALLALLPRVMPVFGGLAVATVFYAVGGGLIETLISPIVEACPTRRKSAAMSFLHSSYCWGVVLVIALSTLFFALFGIENWPYLACIWAILPLINGFFFLFVPIADLVPEGGRMKWRDLFSSGLFWTFVVLMFAAGASELCVAQWASAFAEQGLGVSKEIGDILGPCLFAVMMGIARLIQAKFGDRRPIAYLAASGLLLVAGYLVTSLSPIPALSLAGCALCGFSVGALWPGVYSLAARKLPKGGTSLFALLALAGDLGCAAGPAAVGFAADGLGSLGLGVLSGAAFALLFVLALFFVRRLRP